MSYLFHEIPPEQTTNVWLRKIQTLAGFNVIQKSKLMYHYSNT